MTVTRTAATRAARWARTTALVLTAAAALAGCTGTPQADPARNSPSATAPGPAPAPPTGPAAPNQEQDADLALDRDGKCRFDPDTGTLVQDVTVTGTVHTEVVATVWMTVTGPGDTAVTDTATGHPLATGKAREHLAVSVPLAAEVWGAGVACAVHLTWTPRITG